VQLLGRRLYEEMTYWENGRPAAVARRDRARVRPHLAGHPEDRVLEDPWRRSRGTQPSSETVPPTSSLPLKEQPGKGPRRRRAPALASTFREARPRRRIQALREPGRPWAGARPVLSRPGRQDSPGARRGRGRSALASSISAIGDPRAEDRLSTPLRLRPHRPASARGRRGSRAGRGFTSSGCVPAHVCAGRARSRCSAGRRSGPAAGGRWRPIGKDPVLGAVHEAGPGRRSWAGSSRKSVSQVSTQRSVPIADAPTATMNSCCQACSLIRLPMNLSTLLKSSRNDFW